MKAIQLEIIQHIYKEVQRLGGSLELLAAIGSWGDTLEDGEVLDLLAHIDRTPLNNLCYSSSVNGLDELAVKWAADDRLWNTQEMVEARLKIFGRLVLGLRAHDVGVDERIKLAFPEIQPSGDYDLLSELMGILRVTRMQRDEAEKLIKIYENNQSKKAGC